MFDVMMDKIEDYKKIKLLSYFTWLPLKLFIAYILIENVDFGLYIVLGYILFSLERQSSMQFINANEANYHFAAINNKLDKKTNNMKNTDNGINDEF